MILDSDPTNGQGPPEEIRGRFTVSVRHRSDEFLELYGGPNTSLTAGRIRFHTVLGGAGPRALVTHVSLESLGIDP